MDENSDLSQVDPVDETEPVTVADKPREPTEYEKRLRRENAAGRVKLREAERAVADKDRAIEAVRAENAAAVERVRAEVTAAANQRLIRAEVKAAALAAGMIDLDGLKILDLSDVKLTEAGDIAIPDGFFDRAKAAKPYLFGKPATTSTPETPPQADPPAAKHARDMDPKELAALAKSLGVRV